MGGVIFHPATPWEVEHAGIALKGIGARALLDLPLTAFFASRQCPGSAIRAAMDWALEAAKARRVVISGFHSPLERSVFEVLLTANALAVMALTRDPGHSALPKLWDEAAQRGTLLILGPAGAKGRLTDELARERNNWVASMATHIVVAHAAPVGGLAAQVAGWREDKRSVEVLSP